MLLSCQNICKEFVEKKVLSNVSFHIEDHEKAAIVALIFFCYVRSNPQPLTSVTNKKLLGKIDRSFPDRIKL